MVSDAEGGCGIADFRVVEFGAYGLEGGGLDGVALAVDFDAQFVAGGVGAQVDAGREEASQGGIDVARGLRSRAERHSLSTGSPKGGQTDAMGLILCSTRRSNV